MTKNSAMDTWEALQLPDVEHNCFSCLHENIKPIEDSNGSPTWPEPCYSCVGDNFNIEIGRRTKWEWNKVTTND